MKKGYLVLESGDIFEGMMVGSQSEAYGEVVFNTSMTGYQEIITDPSYAGQFVTFCYPLIGNYGINSFDDESDCPALSGVILSDLCLTPSHYLSMKTIGEYLDAYDVPCLFGIDTRTLVKKIREQGTMKGVLTTNPEASIPSLDVNLVEKVSTKSIQEYGDSGPLVILIDYGHKKSIVQSLVKEGCKVLVVPFTTTFKQIQSLHPDGIVLSNGPGNPMTLAPLFPEIKKITETYPTLGICLGHQLIALVNGGRTRKMRFGHRGGNHPVKELDTGKVWVTAQNHGYVVDDTSINTDVFSVTYRHVNDSTIEGMRHKHLPIETVQFHPEAHPGPSDTHYVFKRFVEMIKQTGGMHHATAN